MSLAKRARELFSANADDQLLALAEENWPDLDSELPSEIGEVARNAYIRCTDSKLPTRELWFARALVAAVLEPSAETAAGLLIRPAFALAEQRQFDSALLVLEEIRRLIKETDASWERLFGRLYHDKRAAVLLLAGRIDEADAELGMAAAFANSPRSRLKVGGGQQLVAYLRLKDLPPDERRVAAEVCLRETSDIHVAATAQGFKDVAGWAETNLQVMRSGRFAGWVPYEVL